MAETYLDEIAAVAQLDDLELGSAGDAHLGLGEVYAVLGQPDAARKRLEFARAAHGATGNHGMVGLALATELVEVMLPYRTTHLEERRQLKAEAELSWARMSDAHATGGLPHLTCSGQFVELLLLEGIWVDARELEGAARSSRSRTVFTWWRVIAGLGALARYQGMSTLAWELVREALPDGPTTEPGGTYFLSTLGLQRLAAELALDAGDLGLARAWIEAHDRWLTWGGSILGQAEGRLLWARYRRLAGEPSLAREHAEEALARADAPAQPLARLAAQRFLGELATEEGRLADAGSTWATPWRWPRPVPLHLSAPGPCWRWPSAVRQTATSAKRVPSWTKSARPAPRWAPRRRSRGPMPWRRTSPARRWPWPTTELV